jgi:D-sedoheptulose 7-phosphate isomerase
LNSNRVDRIFAESADAAEFAEGYLAYLSEILARVDRHEIASFVRTLSDARTRGATLFFLGNGGSAATASHFANDLALGTRASTPPFRVVSLTDNVALMTAAANDYGYDQVFVRQLMPLLREGDVVVAISVSGNSPSVLHAVEYANGRQATTVGVTGFDGGRLRQVAASVVHVPTNAGEYGPAEDVHLVLNHLASAYLTCVVRGETAP